MPILSSPTFALQPAAEQVALSTNYITNFDFLSQYLPDVYEKEFERYGNRSLASFLRMVGAEIPMTSDQAKWTEQGRLHVKYTSVGTAALVNASTGVFQVNDAAVTGIAIRVGQTVMLQRNTTGVHSKGIVTAVNTTNKQFTVAFYAASGLAAAGTGLGNADYSVFIYGSEFRKGTSGMIGSLEGENDIYQNSPVIIKDKYSVSGSDMAQIGWVEISPESGAPGGYLWYLKSQHETRMRFEDYLETSMIEATPAEATSGALAAGFKGSEGLFYVVNLRGNVFGAGTPTALSDWDSVVARLDRQGAIEENALFCNRTLSFDIDNMLATLSGFNGSSAANGPSFGLFDNNSQMALNLGFSGFRRGYDFYKTDWRYLNDPSMRGAMNTTAATATGTVNGILVPAGSTNVYDHNLGENAKRPFLHVRYRASQTENRRYKTWVVGGAGGASTSDLDAMEVHFLSERCLCTLGANNFMLFRFG
jgi:hypothetical protein